MGTLMDGPNHVNSSETAPAHARAHGAGRAMLRYAVPVDGQPHEFRLWSNPVRVETTATPSKVEFRAEGYPDDDWGLALPRRFQVFGTGHPLPDDARWWGTTARYAGLVWHLYELLDTAG